MTDVKGAGGYPMKDDAEDKIYLWKVETDRGMKIMIATSYDSPQPSIKDVADALAQYNPRSDIEYIAVNPYIWVPMISVDESSSKAHGKHQSEEKT